MLGCGWREGCMCVCVCGRVHVCVCVCWAVCCINQNASKPTGLDAYMPLNKPGRGFGFLKREVIWCVGVVVSLSVRVRKSYLRQVKNSKHRQGCVGRGMRATHCCLEWFLESMMKLNGKWTALHSVLGQSKHFTLPIHRVLFVNTALFLPLTYRWYIGGNLDTSRSS